MDRVVYLDIVAVPIYIMILLSAFVRKMVYGHSNKLFNTMVVSSFITAVADLVCGIVASDFPLSNMDVVVVTVFTNIYYIFHNLTPVIYLLFIMSETRTWYHISTNHRMMITFSLYFMLMALLAVNIFTGCVFTVTKTAGYQRGWAIYAFYIGAVLYSAWGITYLIRRRRMLRTSMWVSLLLMYVFNGTGVLIQMLMPDHLVEMLVIAMAELFTVLLVLRPEDYIDNSTGLPSYKGFCTEIRKIANSHNREKIIVMRFINASQLRRYFGDEKYFEFVRHTGDIISRKCREKGLIFDMYYEQPSKLLLIIDNYDFDFQSMVAELYAAMMSDIKELESKGARIIPRLCEINYPEDAKEADTILNIMQQFHRMIPYDQMYTYARDIIGTDSFRIKNNMENILKRAIRDRKFEMYYQPIYSVKDGRFISAEALIRLTDEEYGFISPALFIPAAERNGLMIPIGDFVLESVFRFIGEHDFNELGLSYIELNLSVAQCLQGDLFDKILALEKKYGVAPVRVNLEITETTYENMGEMTDINIRRLSDNGFSFSLDDYGTGYSNMQRISKLPLKIIKIDKTMVDDMASSAGMTVLRNTVTMMKDIRKEIVCEGIESADQLEKLTELGVDFIQGYYFSKPLPEDKFVSFIQEHNLPHSA
ncbi:MAG: EAL domain-containing protein [Ruminiclostridium sp.]|nr:EAL domain-containing protein [Ruminiclostridium sp.]